VSFKEWKAKQELSCHKDCETILKKVVRDDMNKKEQELRKKAPGLQGISIYKRQLFEEWGL